MAKCETSKKNERKGEKKKKNRRWFFDGNGWLRWLRWLRVATVTYATAVNIRHSRLSVESKTQRQRSLSRVWEKISRNDERWFGVCVFTQHFLPRHRRFVCRFSFPLTFVHSYFIVCLQKARHTQWKGDFHLKFFSLFFAFRLSPFSQKKSSRHNHSSPRKLTKGEKNKCSLANPRPPNNQVWLRFACIQYRSTYHISIKYQQHRCVLPFHAWQILADLGNVVACCVLPTRYACYMLFLLVDALCSRLVPAKGGVS